MFSFRACVVSQLILKSFIHLELIFVYGVCWWSSFIFLHVAVQISRHHLLKRLFLLHLMLLPIYQIVVGHRKFGLFWALFCSIDLCLCSYASTRLFWLPWPCNIVWCKVLWSLFALLCQIAMTICSHLWFHINFWNVCSISVKYVMGTLIGIALNL